MNFKIPQNSIFIALGSSLGNSEQIFYSTEKWLQARDISVIKKSKNYKFPPFGGVAQNEFTNAVWEISSQTSKDAKGAQELLKTLLACENAHGRIREKRWDDRTLDLDLLWYYGIQAQTESLTLPHPGLFSRDFVLIPLQEILE